MAFANPADIEMLILDVDGVLTAGEVILDETGKVSYHFNVQDGSGIKYWYRYGGQAAIVTGRSSEAVLVRAKELGIEIVYQSALRKIEAYRRCLADCKIDPRRVACVGDDLPDLPLLRNCGFPVAVNNAVREVKEQAAYVTGRSGGDGAVREVIELLLRAKGCWGEIVAGYHKQTLSGD
ncbi:MAG: HAD hydrolase family protein [Phycisphaerae bacterium]|jgi:3-deoxy-D-manno-octulosonate 8-phosphate phosphatase (KDO 8-P phosphatase)|nr:HAD hydrolase family protein [Phycisphaerae bacterium]